MKHAVPLITQPAVQESSTNDGCDDALANEVRIAADFARLLQQYRRAGYEYDQQMKQSGPVLVSNVLTAGNAENRQRKTGF